MGACASNMIQVSLIQLRGAILSMRKAETVRIAVLAAMLMTVSAFTAEKVSVKLPSGASGPFDVIKITKDGLTLKPQSGLEQTVALDKLDPKEVALAYHQVTPPADAAGRFALGEWFFKKAQFEEAETELFGAVRLDPNMKAKADTMMTALAAMKEVETAKKEEKKKEAKKEGEGKIRIIKVGPDGTMVESPSEGGDEEDFAKKFGKRDVPARTAAEMKEFLDKRLEEIKKIGGTWRMIETKHYYCFSNVPEPKHKIIAQWNEQLYDRLCVVLKHKEGDKLWNNKMPIYYFEKFGQFQHFAAEIDQSPGAAYSGGYFAAQGRDVHICIPFMTERFNSEKRADRMARNTLHHECTHAFLQLTGEDVSLTRWLHEGMAQFIEFWYDRENNEEGRENNPERKDRIAFVNQSIARGGVPTWEKMKMRPMGGTDIEGYAWAWTKLEFLYRNFDNQKLPQFIRLIKAGKTEEDAMQQTFGFSSQKLEEVYGTWVKANAKTGFKFQ